MAAERAWMAAVAAVAVCSAAMAVAWSAHGGYGYGGHVGVDGVGTAALGGGESPLPAAWAHSRSYPGHHTGAGQSVAAFFYPSPLTEEYRRLADGTVVRHPYHTHWSMLDFVNVTSLAQLRTAVQNNFISYAPLSDYNGGIVRAANRACGAWTPINSMPIQASSGTVSPPTLYALENVATQNFQHVKVVVSSVDVTRMMPNGAMNSSMTLPLSVIEVSRSGPDGTYTQYDPARFFYFGHGTTPGNIASLWYRLNLEGIALPEDTVRVEVSHTTNAACI